MTEKSHVIICTNRKHSRVWIETLSGDVLFSVNVRSKGIGLNLELGQTLQKAFKKHEEYENKLRIGTFNEGLMNKVRAMLREKVSQ
jgi:hypothetical protein